MATRKLTWLSDHGSHSGFSGFIAKVYDCNGIQQGMDVSLLEVGTTGIFVGTIDVEIGIYYVQVFKGAGYIERFRWDELVLLETRVMAGDAATLSAAGIEQFTNTIGS